MHRDYDRTIPNVKLFITVTIVTFESVSLLKVPASTNSQPSCLFLLLILQTHSAGGIWVSVRILPLARWDEGPG